MKHLPLLLKNGHLLEPSGKLISKDILIKNGKIQKMAPDINNLNTKIINCHNMIILPNFIDLHVHFRTPGGEYKEDIRSGSYAALKGGFTTVVCMPNTNPTLDNYETIHDLIERIEKESPINIIPTSAISKNLEGKELTNFKKIKTLGVNLFTDDGRGIQNEDIMKKAFKLAEENNISLMQHCEFDHLSNTGVFHKGQRAAELNVPGISSEAEYYMLKRDLEMVKHYNIHYHALHISTKNSVDLIRKAKEDGLNVTAEVTPHHLILRDDDIPSKDPNFKMNPPLRSNEDKKALIKGLRDGVIDIIATDHAPHSREEKQRVLEKSPFGIIGLETAFPLLYTHLVLTGTLSLKQLVHALTIAPAKILKIAPPEIKEQNPANLTIVNPGKEAVVQKDYFLSKSSNSPFINWKLRGLPVMTIYQGNILYTSQGNSLLSTPTESINTSPSCDNRI